MTRIATIVTLAATLSVAGCVTRHQQGGSATAVLPQLEPASITIQQPENPASPAGYSWSETVTVTDPATGYITVTEREIDTMVSGSQDLAKIIKEAMAGEYLKKLLAALFLILGAAVALYKDWPLVAAALAIGAFVSIFLSWWMGGIAVLTAIGLYVGYRAASPIP